MRAKRLGVEIAVQDIAGVRIALEQGANRIELCSALGVGGLTPSAGLIEVATQLARDADRPDFVNVLVRPRGGGFVYSGDEIEVMLREIRQIRELGASGIVLGVLDERDCVDVDTTRALVDAAGGLIVTYHRAIDAAHDGAGAVSALADIGVQRILSSGGAARSVDGARTLSELVANGFGRIEIVAGGNVRVADIAALAESGIGAVHLSARRTVTGSASGPGGGHASYETTDAALVRAAVAAAA